MKHLLIDDLRDPELFGCVRVARTSQEAMLLILTYRWDRIYFDNDLGLNSDKEGWEIVSWLINGVDKSFWPKQVAVVSSNPAARENMYSKFMCMGYRETIIEHGEQIWELNTNSN